MQYSFIIFEALTDFAIVFTIETIKFHFIEALLSESVNGFEFRLITTKRAFQKRCIPVPLVQTPLAKGCFTFRALSWL